MDLHAVHLQLAHFGLAPLLADVLVEEGAAFLVGQGEVEVAADGVLDDIVGLEFLAGEEGVGPEADEHLAAALRAEEDLRGVAVEVAVDDGHVAHLAREHGHGLVVGREGRLLGPGAGHGQGQQGDKYGCRGSECHGGRVQFWISARGRTWLMSVT